MISVSRLIYNYAYNQTLTYNLLIGGHTTYSVIGLSLRVYNAVIHISTLES